MQLTAGMATLEARLAALEACQTALKADNAALKADHAALGARVSVLEKTSPIIRAMCCKFVAEEALRKLQARFGDKPDSQPWNDYLQQAATEGNLRWLEDRGLGLQELALLSEQSAASLNDFVGAPAPRLSLVSEVVQDHS